ncbi:helix-turn-helix transcriptional regulator [Bradyrhizobium macuxiense]|uniref:helix-turn-helix transcriptional regulator n=1 Tax=Bradyrhizobium macuxiense TaxID=1755647 RepID=UPI001FD941C8|nr:LuxR C-terminal-related transcriptional regulator [Bradyrhizobium macuxiense]
MPRVVVQESLGTAQFDGDLLVNLLEAIGTPSFASVLGAFLHALCGARHFLAFRVGKEELTELQHCSFFPKHRSAFYSEAVNWQRAPLIIEAQRTVKGGKPALVYMDAGYVESAGKCHWSVGRDRLVICGRCASGDFGLSILHDEACSPFSPEAIDKLGRKAALLISFLGKHVDACDERCSVDGALSSLPDIEACIIARSSVPPREIQVCARILFGLPSSDIAQDLSVSEQTIKTYRKRIYQRLGIGSERELLTWYLRQWTQWRTRVIDGARKSSIHSYIP